jgi:photosystem II stability/assembly factor-like uncharacterized protein
MFYISTQDGISQWDEKKAENSRLGPEGEPMGPVMTHDGSIVAIGEKGKLWEKKRKEWKTREIARGVAAVSLLRIGDLLYAGTEPARVFSRRLGGEEWELVTALDKSSFAKGFHTPWDGPAAVRTMASNRPNDLYCDIHVGGIICTHDGGKTWEPVSNGLEEDVHQVATHPLAPERIYAATADGFYLSEDEGRSWERRNAGIKELYCRGIALHPKNPDVILLSGSPSPPPGWRRGGPQFALLRTEDAGLTWHKVTKGLPQPSPSVIDTNCITFSHRHPNFVLCGLSSGELFASRDAGITWEEIEKFKEVHHLHWAEN